MDSLPVTNKTAGEPESAYNSTLETAAGMTQVLSSYSPFPKSFSTDMCRTSHP
jgi:hypothetical protein